MKKIIFTAFGLLSMFVFSNAQATENELTSIKKDISSCYDNPWPSECIGKILEKEKIKYESIFNVTIKNTNKINAENSHDLLNNFKGGKASWEKTIQSDCNATGLSEAEKDSQAYSDSYLECLTSGYATRIDFYKSFN